MGKKTRTGGGAGVSVNPQLQEFFSSFNPRATDLFTIDKKKAAKSSQNKDFLVQNFAPFGKFPVFSLRESRVLHKLELHEKQLTSM